MKMKHFYTLFILYLAFGSYIYAVDAQTAVSERTQQVRDAIVAAAGVDSANDVTDTHLASIKVLSLNLKGIKTLKSGDFDGLTALTELVLTRNPLTTLPADIFDELTALEELWLYENDLSALPAGIFDELTAVTYLSLRDNDLSALPDGIFDELTAMKTLNLRKNQLTSLPDGIFDELTALVTIDVGNNQLTSLPDGLFDEIPSVSSILLDENNLSTLPDGIFDGLTGLGILTLGGNTVNPFLLSVSLKKVEDGKFKVTVPTGAPFSMTLSLSVTNGSISGGATSLTISTGSTESEALTVTRTAGATDAVTVDIGNSLPEPPFFSHSGYKLVKSEDLPIVVLAHPGAPALDTAETPDETALLVNYPNPLNPETWIPYHLATAGDVVITIYNARGRVVRRLEFGHQPAGYYTSRARAAHWDGRNRMGERVASGVYFYRLEADTMSFLRKMVILK